MNHAARYGLGALAGVIATAGWFYWVSPGEPGRPAPAMPAPPTLPPVAVEAPDLAGRLDDVLAKLARLESENRTLRDWISRLQEEPPPWPSDPVADIDPSNPGRAFEPIDSDFTPFDAGWAEGLVDAATAGRIRAVFEEAEYEILSLQERAEKDGREPDDPSVTAATRAVWNAARARLGDDDFLAGLFATRRPNRITVLGASDTLDGSLRNGDILLALNGHRVFSLGDILDLGIDPAKGETLTVWRDGMEMYVYLESILDLSVLHEESVAPGEYFAEE